MTYTVIQAESLADIAEGLAATRAPRRMNGHEQPDRAGEATEHPHPLAIFMPLNGEPRPPSWVIPGFVASGVVVIAGAHGAGKTTALVPLALTAAGLHATSDLLAPRHWRHLVYVAEDPEQVRRVLAGMLGCPELHLNSSAVAERVHLVPALRLPPERVAEVGKVYREKFTRQVGSVELPPLVVFDTKAAVLALDDENSNAEASRAVAALKQGFAGLPVWIVGHVSKANMGRADVAALSSRGAGALDADATQTLFLVKEADESRYLVAGKTRFDPKWPELLIEPRWKQVQAMDEFGEPELLTLRWSRPMPPQSRRAEAREAAQEAARNASAAELRAEIMERVDVA